MQRKKGNEVCFKIGVLGEAAVKLKSAEEYTINGINKSKECLVILVHTKNELKSMQEDTGVQLVVKSWKT